MVSKSIFADIYVVVFMTVFAIPVNFTG